MERKLMQTFLPYPDLEKSACCLDYRRLGKQRVETLQILRCLVGISSGWKNHPAVKMWKNHTSALALYGIVICGEWISRGYRDTCLGKIQKICDPVKVIMPNWFGLSEFHSSHRSNLLRKDPNWYGKFGWVESNDKPYYWPSHRSEK